MEALESYLGDEPDESGQDMCPECAGLVQPRWVRWTRFIVVLVPLVAFLAIARSALHPTLVAISSTANPFLVGGYDLHGTVTLGHLALMLAVLVAAMIARDKLDAIGWRRP